MTKSVSVTYRAPKGDAKVTEAFGHTFYDGKAETIEVDDATLKKLRGNRVFEVSEPTDDKVKAYDKADTARDDKDHQHKK